MMIAATTPIIESLQSIRLLFAQYVLQLPSIHIFELSGSQAGGSNCPRSGAASLRRRHSTSSSANVTIEVKATKHTPAKSNNSKPMKLRSQTTLAIEHTEMASSSRE